MTVNPLFVTLLQSPFVGTILGKTLHVFITLLLHPHIITSSSSSPSPDNIYFSFSVQNYGVQLYLYLQILKLVGGQTCKTGAI